MLQVKTLQLLSTITISKCLFICFLTKSYYILSNTANVGQQIPNAFSLSAFFCNPANVFPPSLFVYNCAQVQPSPCRRPPPPTTRSSSSFLSLSLFLLACLSKSAQSAYANALSLSLPCLTGARKPLTKKPTDIARCSFSRLAY